MPSERLEIEGAGNGQNKKTGNGRDERPETAGTQKPEPVGTKGRKRPKQKDRERSGRKTGNGRNKRPETAGQAAGRQPKRRPAAGNELKNFERGILACNTHYDGKGF